MKKMKSTLVVIAIIFSALFKSVAQIPMDDTREIILTMGADVTIKDIASSLNRMNYTFKELNEEYQYIITNDEIIKDVAIELRFNVIDNKLIITGYMSFPTSTAMFEILNKGMPRSRWKQSFNKMYNTAKILSNDINLVSMQFRR
jgi:hypothetical protein